MVMEKLPKVSSKTQRYDFGTHNTLLLSTSSLSESSHTQNCYSSSMTNNNIMIHYKQFNILALLVFLLTSALPSSHAERITGPNDDNNPNSIEVYYCRGCRCAGPRTIDLKPMQMYEYREDQFPTLTQCKQACTDPSRGSKCWKCVADTYTFGGDSNTNYECQHVIYAPSYQASLQTYSSCSEMCEPVALGGDDD